MPKQGWLADNTHRAFPLIDPDDAPWTGPHGAQVLPRDLLADFACILGPGVDTATVTLISVVRASGMLTLTFQGTGDLVGQPLSFLVPATAADFTPCRVTVEAGNGPCGPGLLWEGMVMVGSTTTIRALLGEGEALIAPDAGLPVEPICVHRAGANRIRSINIANRIRRTADAPIGCPKPTAGPYEPDAIVAVATCLQGDVVLTEGYNVAIEQVNRTRTLKLAARPGAGDGMPCHEVPTYLGESPPDGSTVLSGGRTCGELIASINGIKGPHISLVGGPGVVVEVDPTQSSTLLVRVASPMEPEPESP